MAEAVSACGLRMAGVPDPSRADIIADSNSGCVGRAPPVSSFFWNCADLLRVSSAGTIEPADSGGGARGGAGDFQCTHLSAESGLGRFRRVVERRCGKVSEQIAASLPTCIRLLLGWTLHRCGEG